MTDKPKQADNSIPTTDTGFTAHEPARASSDRGTLQVVLLSQLRSGEDKKMLGRLGFQQMCVRVIALCVALAPVVLPVGADAAVPTAGQAAASVSKAKVKPWKGAGYRLPARAPGPKWIGARRAGDLVVYAQGPTGKKVATRVATTPVPVPAPLDAVAARNFHRAAWIVSAFGTIQDRVQATAVEIAIQELLGSRRQGLAGAVTRQRLRWVPDRRSVRRFAKIMLKESLTSAGPYDATFPALSAVDPAPSRQIPVTVTSATGSPVVGAALSLTGDIAAATATGTDGVGVLEVALPAPSTYSAQLTASNIPAELHEVRSEQKSRSGLLVAGLTDSQVQPLRVVRVARPSLTIATSGSDLLAGPGAMSGGGTFTYSDSVGTGTKTVTTKLHGPAATIGAAQAACASGTAIAHTFDAQTVTGSGLKDLVPVPLAAAGYYTISVSVSGDELNLPAGPTCSGAFLATSQPVVTVKSKTARLQWRQGDPLNKSDIPLIEVSGLPSDVAATATITLHGPFAAPSLISCSGGSTSRRLLNTNGVVEGAATTVTVPRDAEDDWYGWTVQLSATSLSRQASSGCQAAGSLLLAQYKG